MWAKGVPMLGSWQPCVSLPCPSTVNPSP
jgi:hypothetical protein